MKKSVYLAAAACTTLLAAQHASLRGGKGSSMEEVRLDSGLISGFNRSGVWTYLGIPFAGSTAGDSRWREPRPVEAWEGIRACREYGPVCPQVVEPLKTGGVGDMPMSEDCLNLNIWSPAADPSEKLPVMVWLYGGAFQFGAGSTPLYDGHPLAGLGAVVVTINYRVGPLGFLAHPRLTQESPHGSSGNYGLLDQIEALKWVKRNIAAFGGDPGRVTIFGESAGGISVCELLVSPLSKGLFHRAICESGLYLGRGLLMYAARSREQAEQIGEQYAADVGCADGPGMLAALRARSMDELISEPLLTESGIFIESPRFVPVVDGFVLPDFPGNLIARGEQHPVPLLIGSNAEEGNLFVNIPSDKLDNMTVEDYREAIRGYFGEYADEVLAAFPVNSTADIKPSLSKVFTVFDFTAPARYAAASMHGAGMKSFLYQFSRVPPRDPLGAFHGLEVPFVFGSLVPYVEGSRPEKKWPRLFLKETERGLEELLIRVADHIDPGLSARIMRYWVNFAANGDPNGEGLPEWPAYEPAADINMQFGNAVKVRSGLWKEACDLADRFYGLP